MCKRDLQMTHVNEPREKLPRVIKRPDILRSCEARILWAVKNRSQAPMRPSQQASMLAERGVEVMIVGHSSSQTA